MAEEYSWWKYLTSPEPYTGYKTKDIAEAAKAMGSGVAGSIFGGTAAAAALPSIGNEGANQVLSDIQGRFQYQPEDKGGDLLQDIAESWPMQQFEKFGEYAGNRAAEFASIHGDEYKPLGYALGKTAPDVLGIAAGYPGAARLATKTSGLLDDAFKQGVSSKGVGGKQAGAVAGRAAKNAPTDPAKWFKDPSGKHDVFEISDAGLKVKANIDAITDARYGYVGTSKLGDAIEHKELFDQYPELKDYNLSTYDIPGSNQSGGFKPESKEFIFNRASEGKPEQTMAHELNHALQQIEKRPAGSSVEQINQLIGANVAKAKAALKRQRQGQEYMDANSKEGTKVAKERGYDSFMRVPLSERKAIAEEASKRTDKQFGISIDDEISRLTGVDPFELYQKDYGEIESRWVEDQWRKHGNQEGVPSGIESLLQDAYMEGKGLDPRYASQSEFLDGAKDYGSMYRELVTSDTTVPSMKETKAPVRKAKARNKSGQYVGAPAGVNSPQALGKIRKDYENSVVQGAAGADWYNDSSDFVKSVTNDPNKAQQMADVLAVTSARTPVDANLGHTIKGINQKAAGYPTKTGGFPNKMEPLIDDILSGNKPELGLKREPFAQNLSVAWAPEKGVRPVHDIWDGRAWGYKKDSGKPWDGGFSAPQHAWMDEQATLLDDRLNARKAGGRDDWNPLRSQAAAWTGKKIESGDIKSADDAAKHFGSYLDKYAANATHEQVPGEGTGQLAGMVDQPGKVRARYSDDLQATWLDERGRDKMYSGAGMATAPSRRGTGVYTPANTGVTEFNPMEVARPLVSRYQSKAKGEPVSLGEWDRDLLNAGESLRAFIDAQNAGAWNTELPGSPAKAQRGVALEMGKKPDPETVAKLQDLAMEKGFFASDTGSGVNLINDPYSAQGAKRGGVSLGKELKQGLGQQLKDISGVDPQRTAIESGFLDFEKEWTQGKGAATKKLFKTLDKNPTAAKNMDTPQVRQKALDNIRRDERYSDELGLPIRKDIQRTRKIFGEEGLEGLRKALDKNPDLLATIGTVIRETYV